MAIPNRFKIPVYTNHASGQAVVRLSGKDIYLGRYGTPVARERYDCLVQEWLAQGRRVPSASTTLTVNELIGPRQNRPEPLANPPSRK